MASGSHVAPAGVALRKLPPPREPGAPLHLLPTLPRVASAVPVHGLADPTSTSAPSHRDGVVTQRAHRDAGIWNQASQFRHQHSRTAHSPHLPLRWGRWESRDHRDHRGLLLGTRPGAPNPPNNKAPLRVSSRAQGSQSGQTTRQSGLASGRGLSRPPRPAAQRGQEAEPRPAQT